MYRYVLASVLSCLVACTSGLGGSEQEVTCDPSLQCTPTGVGPSHEDVISGHTGYACACGVSPACTLVASYASQTSNVIGIISNAVCDQPSAYTGYMSASYQGQAHAIGAWNPVCGQHSGVLLNIQAPGATAATFTLVMSDASAPVASCSATLPLRQ